MTGKRFARILLHVGLHKTGTSSLQRLLFTHRDALEAELGVHYPGFDRNHSQALYSLFCESPASYRRNVILGIDDEMKAAESNKEFLAEFERSFTSTLADQLLLSGEAISFLSVEELARLKDWLLSYGDEIQVLCIVRSPLRWSISAAQSSIGGGETYEEVVERPPKLDLRRRIEGVETVFGREAMRLIDFDQAITQPEGLAGAFFESFSLDKTWLEHRSLEKRNQAMSIEAAHLLSLLNKDRPMVEDGQLGKYRYAGDFRDIVKVIGGKPFNLPRESVDMVLEESEADRQWLASEFGLELDRGDVDGSGPTDDDFRGFSQEAIRTVAIQLHDLVRLRRKHHRLLSRADDLEQDNIFLRRRFREQREEVETLREKAARNRKELERINASRIVRLWKRLRRN